MSNYQGKVNSVYVYHGGTPPYYYENVVEGGWAWLPPDWGYYPRLFMAEVQNNVYV